MDFRDFEEYSRRAYEEIPDLYRSGVDGLTVSKETLSHPTLPEVYTLGQCLTEEHLSDYGSPETVRSIIALYWGSFRALSELDPDFDWEGEIWETLTHELRHHLESLAGDDALEGVDYAADEMFKRHDGLPFDPWFYQHGDALGGGLYQVEGIRFLEQVWEPRDFARASHVTFSWADGVYAIPRPPELGDVHYVAVSGLPEEAALELVLLRRRRWWQDLGQFLGKFLGGVEPDVVLSEAEVAPLGGPDRLPPA